MRELTVYVPNGGPGARAALLAQRPYEGPDQDAEDDMDPDMAPRFSRVELRSMFQVSARQTRANARAARTSEHRAWRCELGPLGTGGCVTLLSAYCIDETCLHIYILSALV